MTSGREHDSSADQTWRQTPPHTTEQQEFTDQTWTQTLPHTEEQQEITDQTWETDPTTHS